MLQSFDQAIYLSNKNEFIDISTNHNRSNGNPKVLQNQVGFKIAELVLRLQRILLGWRRPGTKSSTTLQNVYLKSVRSLGKEFANEVFSHAEFRADFHREKGEKETFFKILPVASCYDRQPPRVTVTEAEVVTILIDSKLIGKWKQSGVLWRKCGNLISLLRRKKGFGLDTIVLVHSVELGKKHENQLIVLDTVPSETYRPTDKLQIELINLVRELVRTIGQDKVSKIIDAARESRAATDFPTPNMLLVKRRYLIWSAAVVFALSIASIAAFGLLLLGNLVGILLSYNTGFLLIGLSSSGLGLLLARELADLAFSNNNRKNHSSG